jgi:hypothetical protein
MFEGSADRVLINKAIYQLDLLYANLTPQEFGRVMQQILACCFEAADYHLVENAVGVPDFVATSQGTEISCVTFAVEVKTTDKPKISITQRDLDGIRTPGVSGVLAVLIFPSRNPRWMLLSEDDIAPGALEIRSLERKVPVDVGFDLSSVFRQAASQIEAVSAPGGSDLELWIKRQRHKFLLLMRKRN